MSLSDNIIAFASRIATEFKSVRSYVDTQIATRVATTDPRLSDARTPTSHTHPATGISDSTATGRSLMTAADAAAARTAIGAGTSNLAIGTAAGTAAAGNDSRLSDARTPTAHTHTSVQISDATNLATVNTIVERDAAGRAQVVDPSVAADIATKGYTDTQVATRAASSHTHTAANISDSTTVGRSVLTAVDAAAARTAIGAGTSSLAIGTTSSTAKAGDYAPPAASQTVSGLIEIATNAEVTTYTDTVRAVTPAGLGAAIDPVGVAVTFNATNAAEFDTVNFSGPTTCYKIGNLVVIRGVINVKVAVAHTAGVHVFTVPAGYRPLKTEMNPTIMNQSATNRLGRLDVGADGLVRITNDSGTNMATGGFWVAVNCFYMAA